MNKNILRSEMTYENYKFFGFVPLYTYESGYVVNKLGEVFCLGMTYIDKNGNTQITPREFIKVTTYEGNDSYATISLMNYDGYKSNETIHHLVFRSFKGVEKEGLQIDHIDGDKSNYRLRNLQQITPNENILRSTIPFKEVSLVIKDDYYYCNLYFNTRLYSNKNNKFKTEQEAKENIKKTWEVIKSTSFYKRLKVHRIKYVGNMRVVDLDLRFKRVEEV